MKPEKAKKMGELAREWTVKNFSPQSVGGIIEEFVDSIDFVDPAIFIDKKSIEKNPHAMIEEIEKGEDWVIALYDKILKRKVDEQDDGFKYWMQELAKGAKRIDIENYFRQVAAKENVENEQGKFEKFLDKDDKGKRLLFVIPESERDVFLCTSLFKSLNDLYPEYNLYVASNAQFFDVLSGNEYVHKVIPYFPQMDSLLWLEGHGDHEGFFEVALLPYLCTQRTINYLHNGEDKIAFNLDL